MEMIPADRHPVLPPATAGRTVPAAVHDATRRALRLTSAVEASSLARSLVRELGGNICSSRTDPDCIAVDISFGSGGPIYPAAPADTPARWMIEQHLLTFLEDLQTALEQHYALERRARDAGIDALTGLPERAAMGRLMARLAQDDVLIAIDLDNFERINESDGRQAGDAVLRAFGRVLRDATRANEVCGRVGGDEFLVVLYQATDEIALAFLSRLQQRWSGIAASLPGFSAGVASVTAAGWRPAMLAADRALLRARKAGPRTWDTACASDYH